MISRYYVTCDVCKTHHTLRVQIGYGDEQRHRFPCHHCDEPISFGLLSGKLEVGGANLTDATTDSDQKTSYQYLSPDFVANSENARNPTYFGSMELMSSLLETPQSQKALAERLKSHPPIPTWFALSDALSDWGTLLVCWRLERSGKYALAIEKLKSLDPDAGTSSWLAAVHFGHRLFGINENLLTEAHILLRQSPTEASRLVNEYGYHWRADFMEAEFQIFSEFFKRWDAFSQVYIYVENGIPMPSDAVATSVDFEHVRGFYAFAQEFFAKHIGLLTALNNIRAGRKFDQLNQISIEKYFSTDNAKRRDNFKDNAIFWSASSEYDSALRNAEAHNWLKATTQTHSLRYMQGGNGTLVEMRYVDYLHKSVTLFRQICHLMQVEALLRSMSQQRAYQLLQTPRIDLN